MEDYRTIHGTATGEYEEKKSRFIAALSFADSEEAAVAFLEQVRAANRTARHNVYAYRLREGNRERYSDDGEPAKTAGTPALEVLQHSGLTDLIVVVTRYFGGVLLGAGPLLRAYQGTAKLALAAAGISVVRRWMELTIPCGYSILGKITQEIPVWDGVVLDTEYGADVVIKALLPEGKEGDFAKRVLDLTAGTVQTAVTGETLKAVPVSG